MGTFLYLIAGIIISIVYTPLSGGNFESFVWTMLIGPVAVLALLIAWVLRGITFSGSWLGRRVGDIFFRLLVGYFSLPILMNAASHLMRWLGYPKVSDFLSSWRYGSLAVVAVAFLIVIFGWGVVESSIRERRSRAAERRLWKRLV